jgi:hypothetical protein
MSNAIFIIFLRYYIYQKNSIALVVDGNVIRKNHYYFKDFNWNNWLTLP